MIFPLLFLPRAFRIYGMRGAIFSVMFHVKHCRLGPIHSVCLLLKSVKKRENS